MPFTCEDDMYHIFEQILLELLNNTNKKSNTNIPTHSHSEMYVTWRMAKQLRNCQKRYASMCASVEHIMSIHVYTVLTDIYACMSSYSVFGCGG